MADLNAFNAILILTGYHSLPRTKLFWEKEEDVGVAMVYEAMSRKDFEEIKRYIHFADNGNLDNNDKFAKVRKPYDIRNKTLQQFGFFRTYYSIDKQMVTYTGKNRSKQTIRTKSITFGYKNFVLSSEMVTLISWIPTAEQNMEEEKFPKIYAPVQSLIV